jgi:hypothetical protein
VKARHARFSVIVEDANKQPAKDFPVKLIIELQEASS